MAEVPSTLTIGSPCPTPRWGGGADVAQVLTHGSKNFFRFLAKASAAFKPIFKERTEASPPEPDGAFGPAQLSWPPRAPSTPVSPQPHHSG